MNDPSENDPRSPDVIFLDKLIRFELACETYYCKHARTLAEHTENKQSVANLARALQKMFADQSSGSP